MKLNYTSVSKIGFKRVDNEDSLGIYELPEGLLLIVCDGLGGNKAGEVASQLTVESIYNTFKDSSQNDFLERIKEALIEANHLVMQKASFSSDLKGMATTAEVLFLDDNAAYWGHVGDSRIYYYRNSKLKQITKDHSLIQKLVDEGHITLKEAENHPNKNIIMRAIGDSVNVEMDISKLKLINKESVKFFICTDGVTTVTNDVELENFLGYENLEEIKEELVNNIENRGAPDNFTFVIVEIKE